MGTKSREVSDANRRISALRRISAAFGKMRYGSMCNFSGITTDDTDEDALVKIAGNIERLGEYIAFVADRAAENERTLDDHRNMFRALGGMMAEVAKHTAPAK